MENVQRTSDGIVAEIESRIANGTFANEQPLPSERLLMEEFGASRTVIREAITALSNRGMLECKPRFRPVVRKAGYEAFMEASSPIVRQLLNSSEGVKNLYHTRVFVERGLVRHAAEHATKDHIRALRSALETNQSAIEDSDAFYQSDQEFHGALYAVMDNPVFTAVHTGVFEWLAPNWQRMLRSPQRNEQNYKAHKAILDGILDRDPEQAEAALVSHLADAWRFVEPTFADQPSNIQTLNGGLAA